MTYQYVCEPCRQALGLRTDPSYLNKIRRDAGGFSRSGASSKPRLEVMHRDFSGKPLVVGLRQGNLFTSSPAGCDCACSTNDHDPYLCTGDSQFQIGGRPGSGAVDRLAERLGSEPIPELVLACHEACQVMVTHFLAWWFGSSDEECVRLESNDLATMRYDDQLKLLRDILHEERPELTADQPLS
jgi:hypothetical protein